MLIANIEAFAQVHTERTYEIIGLQNGDKILEALKTGIPIIFVGIVVMYLSTLGNKNSQNTIGNSFGCIGILIVVLGAFFLLPLLAWIEYAIVNFIVLAIILIIICIIIYWLYNSITKK